MEEDIPQGILIPTQAPAYIVVATTVLLVPSAVLMMNIWEVITTAAWVLILVATDLAVQMYAPNVIYYHFTNCFAGPIMWI